LVPFLGASIYSWLPLLAAAAMAMSSVTVVSNSLLLGRYKPKFAAGKKSKSKGQKEEDRHIYSNKEFKEAYLPKTSHT
jgi:P-type Cu+ transporter